MSGTFDSCSLVEAECRTESLVQMASGRLLLKPRQYDVLNCVSQTKFSGTFDSCFRVEAESRTESLVQMASGRLLLQTETISA